MKKINLYLMAGLAMLMLAACSSEPDSDQVPVAQTYTQNITMPSNASEQLVTLNQVQSSIAIVQHSVSWLTVETQAYSSGSPCVKLRSIDNTSKAERKCNITISVTSGDKVVLVVTQQGSSEGTDIDDIHNSQTDKPAYRRQ